MEVAHMGNILITDFTSSTSVRVDIFHLFTIIPGLLIAALSKKLHVYEILLNKLMVILKHQYSNQCNIYIINSRTNNIKRYL